METLFAKKCARGEGIHLELLEGNPGGLQLTLRQIKAAIRAAMTGLAHDIFMKAVARETLIRNNIGHGKRYPMVRRFRNCLHQVVAKQIVDRLGISHHHSRIVLPNCVASGIRGMPHGKGQFVGHKPKENANPNDA